MLQQPKNMQSLCFLLIAFLLSAFVQSVQIKLKSPSSDTTWSTRSTVLVLWDAEETDKNLKPIKSIDLDLMIGPGDGVLINNISFGVPLREGNAEWIVDPALSDRSDYFVRISSVDDPNLKINGPRFSIHRNMTAMAKKNDASPRQNHPSFWTVSGGSILVVLITFLFT